MPQYSNGKTQLFASLRHFIETGYLSTKDSRNMSLNTPTHTKDIIPDDAFWLIFATTATRKLQLWTSDRYCPYTQVVSCCLTHIVLFKLWSSVHHSLICLQVFQAWTSLQLQPNSSQHTLALTILPARISPNSYWALRYALYKHFGFWIIY